MSLHPPQVRQQPGHRQPVSRAHVAADGYGGLLTVDLAAIRRNYRLLAERVAPAEAAAVVKADAYGLGISAVASALYAEGCRTFFVAHVEEGVQLRSVLQTGVAIFVLHGPPPGAEPDCDTYALTPVLNCLDQLKAWLHFTSVNGLPGQCAIQFDTGMARFGFDLSETETVATALAEVNLRPCLVMSHLACADEAGNPANRTQLDRLRALRSHFPLAQFSIAASSGIFLGPDYHLDVVRPGAALYGVRPVPDGPNPMLPVVRLRGRIMQVRAVPAGTAVAYGFTANIATATHLATVAIGYADGFLRTASNRAAAWLGSQRLPLVGRVSMDSIIVDLGALPGDPPRVGELVDVLGPQYGVDDLAADAGTIGYEVLTSLGTRYWRDYTA